MNTSVLHPLALFFVLGPLVASSLGDLSKARDITGIEALPPPPPGPDWLLGTGLTLGVLLLAGTVWVLLRRWFGKPQVLEPDQWAWRELDRIEGLNLPGAGEVERYHTLLAEVVRGYLEKRFRIPATTRTTAEFLEALERLPASVPAPQHAAVRQFLEHCDLAKFARARFSGEECQVTANLARRVTTGTDA
jgi:hypothetical protein